MSYFNEKPDHQVYNGEEVLSFWICQHCGAVVMSEEWKLRHEQFHYQIGQIAQSASRADIFTRPIF